MKRDSGNEGKGNKEEYRRMKGRKVDGREIGKTDDKDDRLAK